MSIIVFYTTLGIIASQSHQASQGPKRKVSGLKVNASTKREHPSTHPLTHKFHNLIKRSNLKMVLLPK